MIRIDVSWIADLVRENTEDPKIKAPLCKAFADKFSQSDPSFKDEEFMKRCNSPNVNMRDNLNEKETD